MSVPLPRRLRMACAALAILASAPAAAADFPVGDIVVSAPWARATAPAAPAGSVYMSIGNGSGAPDRLLDASTPASERVEFHSHMAEDGIMRMRQVPSIDVAPGTGVTLAPGGLHLMLIGLRSPLVQGTSFPLTLSFEKAGTVQVDVDVAGPGASAPPGGSGHQAHGGDHDGHHGHHGHHGD